jgi:hypothetical protein
MGKVRLHDSARPHTGLPTGQDTATVPISHLLTPVSFAHWRMHSEEAVLRTMGWNSVSVQTRRFSRGFHTTGIERFTHGWKKCVDNEEDPCKSISVVKTVPITRVNFIMSVITATALMAFHIPSSHLTMRRPNHRSRKLNAVCTNDKNTQTTSPSAFVLLFWSSHRPLF